MNIEQEIFKKKNILFDQLIPYGFTKVKDQYFISKNILNDSFRIDVTITAPHTVKGKIYDLSFNEEYPNFRISNERGAFVNKVRTEFITFLNDICSKCTTSNYFITPQANRLTNLIIKEFNNYPEFLWEKDQTSGVFRNTQTKKWYGLIMNIDQSKIMSGHGAIEILNLKLAEDKIKQLLKRPGFYKAYHMNKEKWLTISLNDSVSDDEIMNYLKESYNYSTHK